VDSVTATDGYLYEMQRRSLAQERRRNTELLLGIVAGEPCTVFGRPARITVEWPDGLPLGKTDPAEVQAWAAAQLADLRRSDRP
jgi:hypothetical protein